MGSGTHVARRSVGLTMAILLMVGAGLPVLAAGGRFDDDDASVHEADIEYIADLGITTGCGERSFCPEDPVTRGQMAAFLNRTLDLQPSAFDAFDDDDLGVFEGDIDALAASGITTGCADRRFCPDDPVTRGQMAAFLVRGYDLTGAGSAEFVDDDDSVFENDIEKLATAGITLGCNPPANDRFCPDDPVTRGQMASFLARAIRSLDDGGGGDGDGDGDGDDDGNVTTTTLTSTGWHLATVDSRSAAGRWSSVRSLGSVPAVSYWISASGDLGFARCDDAACTSNEKVAFTTAEQDGRATSMAIIGGVPVIAHVNTGTSTLRVVRCDDAACGSYTVEDPIALTVTGPSITSVGGNPVIAYRRGDQLQVAVCTDPACTTIADDAPNVLATGASGDVSAEVAGGVVVVAFRAGGDLKLAVCDDATCASATVVDDLDQSTDTIGGDLAMTVIGGNPTIVYRNTTIEGVEVVRCTSPACASLDPPVQLEAGNVGLNAAITGGADGFPWVAYEDGDALDLKFVNCDSDDCATRTSPVVVDTEGETDFHISIANVNGVVVITYLDNVADELRLARDTTPEG
jgi:S-layer homology domain